VSSTILRRFLLLPASAVLLAATALPARGTTLEKVVSGVYALENGGRFELDNVNGAVTIEAWDRAEVEVRAQKVVKSPSDATARKALAELKVTVDAKPGLVRVKAHFPHSSGGVLSWLSGHSVDRKVEFHVKVPRQADLHVETINGGVSLHGGQGELTLRTTNGGVSMADASGKLSVDSVNGSLDLRHVSGSIEASTVNGSIEAEIEARGASSLSSVNGSVTLKLPRNAQATISASTTNGRVTTDLPIEGKAKRTSLSGDLNGGGPRIEVGTTNGRVEILGL